jgi:hypothetical protein
MHLQIPSIYVFIFIFFAGMLVSKTSSAQFPKIQLSSIANFFKSKPADTLNKTAMPIAVGYTDFDDVIRDLQLLGKIPSESSLTIRPYILPKLVSYDSLLLAIDPELLNEGHLVRKKHFDVQLLPFNYLQKYNSDRPYGWNDGPLSFSNGYQYLASGGAYFRWRNIHLTLRPEYYHTASDKYETSSEWGQVNPSLNKLTLGQSNLRIDFGPISIGGGNNNIWLGPGLHSSLIMSNNAPGFGHAEITTNRPIKTPIGNFELILLGGNLTQNQDQGFENFAYNLLHTKTVERQIRYLNILNITYTPPFFENFYLGFNRVFHSFAPLNTNNFKKDYFLVLNNLFRNQYRDDDKPIDQLLSVYTRYFFPKSHAEIYFEYGLNDGSSNLRELLTDLSHSAASIFGFKKLQYLTPTNYLSLNIEATRKSQTTSYLLRNAGNWYEHNALTAGYTNQNQIIGDGSGFGNNVQTAFISYGNLTKRIGIKYQHIEQNPRRLVGTVGNLWLGDVNWNDYAYGIQAKYNFNKIMFNLEGQWVKSNNYMWQNGNQKTNLYIFLNTIYTW